jgi:hypothetical protein
VILEHKAGNRSDYPQSNGYAHPQRSRVDQVVASARKASSNCGNDDWQQFGVLIDNSSFELNDSVDASPHSAQGGDAQEQPFKHTAHEVLYRLTVRRGEDKQSDRKSENGEGS